MAKKAVAKQSDYGVEEEKPSYLKEMEQKGPVQSTDNFDQDDIGQPLIKIIQGTSAENETYDDAKPGIFWHTGADEPLGKELTFVVAARNKKMLLQAPLEDGQGILARAPDAKTWDRTGEWEVESKKYGTQIWTIKDKDVAKSGLADWGSMAPDFDGEQSPPAATLFYDYLIVALDEDGQPYDFGPAVLSLARTQIKKAKKGLNDKIKMHQGNGRPMQSVVFKAEIVKEGSGSETWYNLNFKANGFASEKLYHEAAQLSEMLADFQPADEESVGRDAEKPAAESDDF